MKKKFQGFVALDPIGFGSINYRTPRGVFYVSDTVPEAWFLYGCELIVKVVSLLWQLYENYSTTSAQQVYDNAVTIVYFL